MAIPDGASVNGTTHCCSTEVSYQVEPRITIPAPTTQQMHSISLLVLHLMTLNLLKHPQYTGVASESNSDGSGATFDVTRNGAKYYVTVNAGGQEFTRLDTVIIQRKQLRWCR